MIPFRRAGRTLNFCQFIEPFRASVSLGVSVGISVAVFLSKEQKVATPNTCKGLRPWVGKGRKQSAPEFYRVAASAMVTMMLSLGLLVGDVLLSHVNIDSPVLEWRLHNH